jgi:hypothetical protein
MKGIGSILLAAAVAGGHYAYYAWPAGWSRSWAQWVGLNALVIVLALLLVPAARRQVGVWQTLALCACWLAVIESGQAAACSVIAWGSVPKSDLCIEAIGPWPYIAAAAICAALLIARRGRQK